MAKTKRPPPDSPEGTLERFRAKSGDFARLMETFMAMGPQAKHAGCYPLWEKAAREALRVRYALMRINEHLDRANNMMDAVFGSGLIQIAPGVSQAYMMGGLAAMHASMEAMRQIAFMLPLLEPDPADDPEVIDAEVIRD